MCVWLGECKNCTVKRFEWSSRIEKRYINPFTIYLSFAWEAYTQGYEARSLYPLGKPPGIPKIP